jgi:hypothetical protein
MITELHAGRHDDLFTKLCLEQVTHQVTEQLARAEKEIRWCARWRAQWGTEWRAVAQRQAFQGGADL